LNTDPIADLLTRIRNANSVYHEALELPSSKVKVEICRILQEEGYIRGYEVLPDSKQGILKILLKYGPKRERVIQGLRRISTPGRRHYVSAMQVPRVRRGLGTAILTTPQGVLADRDCRRRRIGGEVLCFVW
jgi:small subunit ribosomal protein S8